MKKANGIIWGIALIALGLIFGLNALKITDISLFFDGWWTLFIIVPCAVGLFTDKNKPGNLIGLLIGAALFLSCRDILSFGLVWKLAAAAVIIAAGIKMIFGGGKDSETEKILIESGAVKRCCAAFSGQNADFSEQAFEGAELAAVFGGVKCDLRKAVIEKDAAINAMAIFGGVEILAPDNVNIKTNSISIFGGVSNKKTAANNQGSPTLHVSGLCLFGGVDIR